MHAPTPSTDARHARQEAVAAGLASVRLEGFTPPGELTLINARFVRGDLSAAERLAQARALCESLARRTVYMPCHVHHSRAPEIDFASPRLHVVSGLLLIGKEFISRVLAHTHI